jgi:hypothetical protein
MPRGEDFTNQSNHAASPAAEVGGSQRILLAFARAAHRDALRQIGRSAVAGESAPRGVAARYQHEHERENMPSEQPAETEADFLCDGCGVWVSSKEVFECPECTTEMCEDCLAEHECE